MGHIEGMTNLTTSAQNDPGIDKHFLAKNALQFKLASALGYSIEDHDSFLAFSEKYGEEESFKFDVRAYTYQGTILLLGARVYRGQTTNFRTLGGGFASVFISEK